MSQVARLAKVPPTKIVWLDDTRQEDLGKDGETIFAQLAVKYEEK
jgi:hypothetical protein